MLHRLTQDSAIYFIGRLTPAALSFAFVAIFIRILGSEDYGKFSLIQTVILFVGAFGSSWLTQALLRFNGVFKTGPAQHRLNSLIEKGFIYTCFACLPIVIVFVVIGSYPVTVLVISLLATLYQIRYSIYLARQSSLLNPKIILIADIVRMVFLFLSSFFLTLYIFQGSYIGLLVGMVLGNIAGTIIVKRGIDGARVKVARESKFLISFLKYGAPLAVWTGISVLLNLSDRYLIAWLLDVQSLGVYSAVYDVISKCFALLLTPILSAAHPIIMNLHNSKLGSEAYRAIVKALILQIGLAFFSLIGFMLFSKQIVFLLIGEHSAEATSLVLPVAIGTIIWQLAMLIHKPLEIDKKIVPMIFYVLIALFVNLLGNVIFLPKYGYIVAAYTTIAGASVYISLVFFHLLCNNYLVKFRSF